MRILSLTIENILSIEYAHLEFPEAGLILVEGWNYDTGSANGAGKTAIFEALAWALFNQFPRTTTISDFVKIGSKNSKVSVTLHTKHGKISIERSRPKDFKATIDGAILMEEEYAQLLPINYQQFIISQYACQAGGLRFLELNDSGRKDLILELMRADGFAEAKQQLDAELKDCTAETIRLSSEISNLNTKISAYKESLIDEASHSSEILNIQEAIKNALNEIKQLEIQCLDDEYDKHREMLDKLSLRLNEILIHKGKLNVYRKMIKDALPPQVPPGPDGACPCCGTDIDVINDVFIKHDKTSIKAKHEERQAAYDAHYLTLVSSINDLESKIKKEDQINNAIESIKHTIREKDKQIKSTMSRINELNIFVQQSQLKLEMMHAAIDKQTTLITKIKHIKHEICKMSEKLEEKNNRVELLRAGSLILSPLGAPAYVMDSVVQGINDKIHDIIQLIWPNSSYELQSFKENKTGKITTKMSDQFLIDGIKRPIGSLSGGERRCLSIAIDFALIAIISAYTGAELNPLILDEPFDHLDASNRVKVIDLLREMANERCIIVIDHAAEAKAMFDKSISVVKKSGITMVS